MPILIDGHIHIHPAVDLDRMLDCAWNNFAVAETQLFADDGTCSFVLLLVEGKKNDVFATLRQKAESGEGSRRKGWRFKLTEETNSILAVNEEKQIVLVAGRQLISREKLELLSLFCPYIVEDGKHSLPELAIQVTDKGGLPLIAWGVGKWLGHRSRVVQEFLEHPPVPVFLVGDNGNRPWFWPYPKLLALAEKQGIHALAGSDPLPLACHLLRAGSYGGGINDVVLSEGHPADELQKLLSSAGKILPYGRRVGLLQFICDQVKVNLQKRLGRSGR